MLPPVQKLVATFIFFFPRKRKCKQVPPRALRQPGESPLLWERSQQDCEPTAIFFTHLPPHILRDILSDVLCFFVPAGLERSYRNLPVADCSACQKSTDLSKKPPQYPVGATIGRPAILEQNCIAKCDYFLFSSKTATIALQLLRGRRIAAPTVSNEADGFLTV